MKPRIVLIIMRDLNIFRICSKQLPEQYPNFRMSGKKRQTEGRQFPWEKTEANLFLQSPVYMWKWQRSDLYQENE